MTIETGSHEPDWDAFISHLDRDRTLEQAKEKTLERIYGVLERNADKVDEMTPGDVSKNINLDLQNKGWETQRYVIPGDPELLPDNTIIDIVANDPINGLTVAIPVGFSEPTRSRVQAVNLYNPDLAVFPLIRPPRSRSKTRTAKVLATAVRDVEVTFRIYHMLKPWGEPVLMHNELRDKIRGK